MAVFWADHYRYQSGSVCLLMLSCCCSSCSSFPLQQLFPSWQECRAAAALLGRVQATRLASCLHPRVIVHSDFKCATTISSLHQIPCISSFLKCQACLLSDVNDYGHISEKYLLLVLFQCAYYWEWLVVVMQSCLAGEAGQLAIVFLV